MTEVFQWMGREDPEDGLDAKRWHQLVSAKESGDALGALLGFPCDEGVRRNKGRVGAKNGPDAIRGALANMAWHGREGSITDLGNVSLPNEADLLAAQNALSEGVASALTQFGKVLVLGGGHETAAGSFSGLLSHLGQDTQKRIGIINLDAHFDLRKPGEAGVSSGTPFFQIHQMLQERGTDMKYMCLGVAEISNTKALFQRAKDWKVDYMLDTEVRAHKITRVCERISAFLKDCDMLYLTIDLDVLPHWQMPGVSAPAPLGVELAVVEEIVDYLGTLSIEWPLSDVVEFNPEFDISGAAGKVAARLCDKIMRTMTMG